jgi:hypothetical protein
MQLLTYLAVRLPVLGAHGLKLICIICGLFRLLLSLYANGPGSQGLVDACAREARRVAHAADGVIFGSARLG